MLNSEHEMLYFVVSTVYRHTSIAHRGYDWRAVKRLKVFWNREFLFCSVCARVVFVQLLFMVVIVIYNDILLISRSHTLCFNPTKNYS